MVFKLYSKLITIIILIVFIIFFLLLAVYTAKKNESFSVFLTDNVKSDTVIIDAGHGGADGGATGIDGTLEKEINLEIAMKVRYIMTLYGYKVIMTRSDGDSIHDKDAVTIRQQKVSDIHNREKIINQNPDAIFISIHQNHFENTTVQGTQVFYSKNNPLSSLLAQSIQNSVVKNIQNDNSKQIKKSGTEIYLLYHSVIPSVMIECGFMSNRDDMKILKNNDYQKKLSLSIADGIINYYKECDNNGTKK